MTFEIDKGTFLLIILGLVFVYVLFTLFNHYFPPEPAFTTQADFEKFLKLNKDQYYAVMKEAKAEFAKEVMNLLKARDAKVNESIDGADESVRKLLCNHMDTVANKISIVGAAEMQSWLLMANILADKGFIEGCPVDPENKSLFLIGLYQQMNPKMKDLVFIKS